MNRMIITTALVILSLFYSATSFAFEEMDINQYCRTDPPPPGFTGPSPTNYCRLSWSFESGHPKTDYMDAWADIYVTSPNVGQTDHAEEDYNLQELHAMDHKFWVVQVVCTADLEVIQVKLESYAVGWMIIQLPWVIRTQNSYEDAQAFLHEGNCPY